jgi:hypothetical protein
MWNWNFNNRKPNWSICYKKIWFQVPGLWGWDGEINKSCTVKLGIILSEIKVLVESDGLKRGIWITMELGLLIVFCEENLKKSNLQWIDLILGCY